MEDRMNEEDLWKLAERYSKIAEMRTMLQENRWPGKLMHRIEDTFAWKSEIQNAPQVFLDEVNFIREANTLHALLTWLGSELVFEAHDKPMWIVASAYELGPEYNERPCTRFTVSTYGTEEPFVQGEVLFFPGNDRKCFGCFKSASDEEPSDFDSLVHALFYWLAKSFRPRLNQLT
jgi:hypothetical protein